MSTNKPTIDQIMDKSKGDDSFDIFNKRKLNYFAMMLFWEEEIWFLKQSNPNLSIILEQYHNLLSNLLGSQNKEDDISKLSDNMIFSNSCKWDESKIKFYSNIAVPSGN